MLINLLLQNFIKKEVIVRDLDEKTASSLFINIDYNDLLDQKPDDVNIKELLKYILNICYTLNKKFEILNIDDKIIIDYILNSNLPMYNDKGVLLEFNSYTIEELLKKGFKHPDFLKKSDLLKKSNLLEIFGEGKYNKDDLKKSGILKIIKKDSQNLDGLITIGFNIKELKDLGFTIELLSSKGFKKEELVSNGFTPDEYGNVYKNKANIFENNYEIRYRLLSTLKENKTATQDQLKELETLKK